MSAWWEGLSDKYKLDPVESENGYYVGMQVVKSFAEDGTFEEVLPPVVISENDTEPKELYLISTIPITCPNQRCLLEVVAESEKDDNDGAALETCIFR